MEDSKKSGPVVIYGVIALIVALVVYGAFRYMKRDKQSVENTTSSLSSTTPPVAESPNNFYKDGEYTAMGDYFSPGGAEQVSLQVTLKNDVIVSATLVPQATRPESIKYQGKVVVNFQPFVIGKKIDTVKLDKVSGSSLTPKGFNDAVAKIKIQAQA